MSDRQGGNMRGTTNWLAQRFTKFVETCAAHRWGLILSLPRIQWNLSVD